MKKVKPNSTAQTKKNVTKNYNEDAIMQEAQPK